MNGVLCIKRRKIKVKRATHLGAPGVVKPHFGPVVVVPLPLGPWYLQSVMMYAEGWSCNHARARVGAALLCVLGTCQVVLMYVTPGAFSHVRCLITELLDCLKRLLCASAARAAVCSSVRRERSVFPLTMITPRGPGILSLRYA